MGTEPSIPIALLNGLREAIKRAGMTDRTDLILPLARPCIRIRSKRVPTDEITSSDSFFGGGIAFLPAGAEWPMAKPWALNPIARINLGEASRFDLSGQLPRTGFLTFWYDQQEQLWGFKPEDREGFRVTYVADEDALLERRRAPCSINEFYKPEDDLDAARLSFEPVLSLPHLEELPEGHPLRTGEGYLELVAAWNREPCNSLLGYPRLIQGPMQEECQYVSNGIYCGTDEGHKEGRARGLQAGAADWQLLLQLDTDSDQTGHGWMWGDMGMLYFWIRKQDLARADFSKCWQILQCG